MQMLNGFGVLGVRHASHLHTLWGLGVTMTGEWRKPTVILTDVDIFLS